MFQKDAPINVSLTKAVAVIWFIFTTLYFLLSITIPMIAGKVQSDMIVRAQIQGHNQGVADTMQSLSGNVFQNGYVSAVGQLVGALDKQIADGCKEPVPVQIGTGSVGIMSIPCLQKLQEAASAQSPTSPEKK